MIDKNIRKFIKKIELKQREIFLNSLNEEDKENIKYDLKEIMSAIEIKQKGSSSFVITYYTLDQPTVSSSEEIKGKEAQIIFKLIKSGYISNNDNQLFYNFTHDGLHINEIYKKNLINNIFKKLSYISIQIIIAMFSALLTIYLTK